MDGKLVKEKLKKCGVSLSEIAARLGYENDQRLHSQLKSGDVKTGLLEDIARVIGVNMSFFYGDAAGAGSMVQNGGEGNVQGHSVVSSSADEVAFLRDQLKRQQDENSRLLSILEKIHQK